MDRPKVGPLLNASDAGTTTWDKIKRHYEERLASLRKKNDRNMPPEETAFLRGQIRECRAILTLDEQTPTIEFKPTDGR